MLSITLLLQVPQTTPIRYVFGFVREIITCTQLHISLRSLHRVQYVRLLLFYSVIFQSCKFSYPKQRPCNRCLSALERPSAITVERSIVQPRILSISSVSPYVCPSITVIRRSASTEPAELHCNGAVGLSVLAYITISSHLWWPCKVVEGHVAVIMRVNISKVEMQPEQSLALTENRNSL